MFWLKGNTYEYEDFHGEPVFRLNRPDFNRVIAEWILEVSHTFIRGYFGMQWEQSKLNVWTMPEEKFSLLKGGTVLLHNSGWNVENSLDNDTVSSRKIKSGIIYHHLF